MNDRSAPSAPAPAAGTGNFSSCRIAVFDAKPYDREFFTAANADYGFDLTFFETRLRSQTVRLAEGFDAVCIFVNDELDKEVISRLAEYHVGLIALRCAGYNNVNLKAACLRGIPVVRVPQYSPCAVAEYALALMMTLNRRIHHAYNRVRSGNFALNGLLGSDLRGKTIGVVGTGRIGLAFAELLQGFGVRLLASDPFPNYEAAARMHFQYVPLDELLAASDVISLHCPLTPENHHLIGIKAIRIMKPGVILINTSRGKLIDSAALIGGLKTGRIGAAGLDVYEEETEYFFEDRSNAVMQDDVLARLTTFPNVILTSHQAFFTREALSNIAAATFRSFAAFASGGKLVDAIASDCGGVKNCPGKRRGEKCRFNGRL